MSTLIIDELFNGVNFDQRFKIKNNTNIVHIRPWVYLHGTLVDGDFTLEVYEGATLLTTSTINYTTINAAKSLQFAHGYMRFDFDSLSLKIPAGATEQQYTLRFYMNNHITDTSNFLGICRNWEIKYYDTYGSGVISNQAPNDFVEPAGIEIYELRNR